MEGEASASVHTSGQSASSGSSPGSGGGFDFSIDNKIVFFVVVIAIIAINIYMRIGLLRFEGLFEPDAFFYLALIQQTIAHGFVGSSTLLLSGFPYHNNVGEAPGLEYTVLVPYFFLRFLGVNVYTVMIYVPMVFGILSAVFAYYLIKYLSKSRALGLLAMFFVSVSSGNVARTAAAVFRGDSFVGPIILLMLIFMLASLNADKRTSRKYYYAVAAAMITSFANVVWNGGLIAIIIYMAAVLFLFVFASLLGDRDRMHDVFILSMGLLLAGLLESIYPYIGITNQSALGGLNFFIFFLPIVAGILVSMYLLDNQKKYGITNTFLQRTALLLVCGLIILGIMLLFFGHLINNFVFNGSVVAAENIGKTTQELQPISYPFLFASFSFQLFLAPIGIICAILFSCRIKEYDKSARSIMLDALPSALLLILIAIVLAWYTALVLGLPITTMAEIALAFVVIALILYRLFAGSGAFTTTKLNITVGNAVVILLAYFIIVGYLQANAIRYNALFSLPLALFAAYGAYAPGKVLSEYSIKGINLKYVYTGLMFVILAFTFYVAQQQTLSSIQADGLNPQFLTAMSWMRNNTPANATVLTLWPDGSVVEAWGGRQSWMDSVGGENGTRILHFADWLLNTSSSHNANYLYSIYKPQYFVVRNFWFQEFGGLAQESSISNLTAYGFDTLSSLKTAQNGTQAIYTFLGAPYLAEMIVTTNAITGNRSIQAYIGENGQTTLVPIKQVIFYNSSNNGYGIATSALNLTANYTLLVEFSGTQIFDTAILGPKLAYTNAFAFLMECGGPSYCPFNSNNMGVKAQLVYGNPDTKIFKLSYPS